MKLITSFYIPNFLFSLGFLKKKLSRLENRTIPNFSFKNVKSFPFLFLPIKRPKWVSVTYTNENNEEVEETLHGMPARIFQHENEHMNGYVFIDLVSKLKLERAEKAKEKMIKEIKRRQGAPKIVH